MSAAPMRSVVFAFLPWLLVCGALLALVGDAHADPVERFILRADSLARLDDPAPLRAAVNDEAILIGAVVGQLLDVAFEVEGSMPEGAADNVALAARLATLHEELNGSSTPRELVALHRGWTDDERATKRRASALEAEATELRNGGDPDAAIEKLEQARALYASIGDRRAQAINWGSQGVAHWYRQDWDAVRSSYDRALEARREIEDRILEGRTLNGQGSVRLTTGDPEAALEWYEKAIALRDRTGDLAGLATSLTYAGQAAEQLGRVLEARRYFQRARPLLVDTGNDRSVVELEISVGVLYNAMGRSDEALAALARAMERIEAAPEYESLVRLQRADAYRAQGQLRESLDEIRAAESLAPEGDDPVFDAQLRIARGLTRLELGELDDARVDLERARDLADQLGVPEWSAATRANLALVHLNSGEPERALALADSARARLEGTADEATRSLASELAADALYALGRFDEALERADQALELGSMELVTARLQRANALARLGQPERAREENRRALVELRDSGRTETEYAPLLGIGDSFESSDPDSARFYYVRALEVLERQRSAAGTAAVRTSFLAARRGAIYEDVVHYFAEQYRRTGEERWSADAFATAERARARGLVELLQQSYDPSDDPEVQRLLDELYALGDPSPQTREPRRRLEDDLARKWDAYLADTAPLVAEFSLARAPRDVGALLAPDDLVLAYAVGDSATQLWAVDGRGHVLVELPGRDELRATVVELRRALQAPGFGDARLRARSRELYRVLVDPVADRLRGKENLIVVADDVLFDLPFEALLTEDFDGDDWRRAPFLAKRMHVAYAPSASVLLQLRQRPPAAATANVLAVGDPDFRGLPHRAGQVGDLPPLPHSRDEVEALERLARGEILVLVGADATEPAVRDALVERRPRIVHLATHGLVDREEPSLTAVALAPAATDVGHARRDGYLYMLEVLALPLDTELVVLSACDTGRGKLERGEGTIGLTRSFLAAGARRVVASLWPVADASTATLMARFYEELLRRGRPVDEALNRAREQLWRERDTAHPYFWAPFVLMGTDAPLPTPSRG